MNCAASHMENVLRPYLTEWLDFFKAAYRAVFLSYRSRALSIDGKF